ncbi:hypothetical protein YC2023_067892 [Brassica napus]
MRGVLNYDLTVTDRIGEDTSGERNLTDISGERNLTDISGERHLSSGCVEWCLSVVVKGWSLLWPPSASPSEGLNPVSLSWILELVLVGLWFCNGEAVRWCCIISRPLNKCSWFAFDEGAIEDEISQVWFPLVLCLAYGGSDEVFVVWCCHLEHEVQMRFCSPSQPLRARLLSSYFPCLGLVSGDFYVFRRLQDFTDLARNRLVNEATIMTMLLIEAHTSGDVDQCKAITPCVLAEAAKQLAVN